MECPHGSQLPRGVVEGSREAFEAGRVHPTTFLIFCWLMGWMLDELDGGFDLENQKGIIMAPLRPLHFHSSQTLKIIMSHFR